MYRLQQPQKYGIESRMPPSATVSGIFAKANEVLQNPNLIRIETPKPLENVKTVQIPFDQTREKTEEERKNKNEFEQMVLEKLGKLDEVVGVLKEKHDSSKPDLPLSNNSVPVIKAITNVKEKSARTKKTYYAITENMWSEIKARFPDLPDTCRNNTFSDGVEYYVEHKNKKIVLDGKGLLKILNNKNK